MTSGRGRCSATRRSSRSSVSASSTSGSWSVPVRLPLTEDAKSSATPVVNGKNGALRCTIESARSSNSRSSSLRDGSSIADVVAKPE